MFKRQSKKRVGGARRWRRRRPADLSDLVGAIKAEGAAARAEERREDLGKTVREWTTIIVLLATCGAILWQVHEMRKVYEPIRNQAAAASSAADATSRAADATKVAADATTAATISQQRAWVGPATTSFVSEKGPPFSPVEPTPGKPVHLLVPYQNTGREPATAFGGYNNFLTLKHSQIDTKFARDQISMSVATCRNTRTIGGAVIYPSTGNGVYTFMSDGPAIDQQFLDTKGMLVVLGCFTYVTAKTAHHSAFCYFYLPGSTKGMNLSLCTLGNEAD